MKKFFLLLCLAPVALHAQRLSYTISGKPAVPADTALIVSNIIPIEGLIPKLLVELRARGYSLALVKGEINLEGMTRANSPFAPEIGRVLALNVLNNSVGEAAARLDVQYMNLDTGARRGTSLSLPRDNPALIASELAKFLGLDAPKKIDPLLLSVSPSEARFPASDFPGLRKGDEISVRFPELRGGLAETKVKIKRLEKATNAQGQFESFVIAENKNALLKEGDRVLRVLPRRHRFSLSVMGEAAIARTDTLSAVWKGQTYTGQKLWGGGFILQGEYEKFLPYGLTSTTTFGLNVDSSLNTFLMSGIGWRAQGSAWELVPSLRLGIAYAPLSFSGARDTLQGSAIRFGLDIGVSFLYHFGGMFSMGFDIGIQYWFYSLGLVYQGSQKADPEYPGGQVPLAYLYPRFGLKFAWSF